jgi:hypothetical protein
MTGKRPVVAEMPLILAHRETKVWRPHCLAGHLDDSVRRQDDPVLSAIAKRQYADWCEVRHVDVTSPEVKKAIERFCQHIHDALYQPCPSLEDRKAQTETSPLPRFEAEQKRQEADTGRRADEERRPSATPEPRPTWARSRRAAVIGSLIGAAIIGAIGVWIAITPPPVAPPVPPVAPSITSVCADISGSWHWVSRFILMINSNGTMGGRGTWTCSSGVFVLKWNGGITDWLSLWADGNRLSGTNNQGGTVWGVRVAGAPPPRSPAAQSLRPSMATRRCAAARCGASSIRSV